MSRLSVNAIVAEASMAKGSFYQHWPTRRDYLVALHRAFHDQPAEPIAVLLVAAVAEIALHELTTGHRRDDLRNAVLALASRGARPCRR